MTDEEKAALREDIENLTIKQARARAETATETLRVLSGLGIVAGVVAQDVGLRMLTLPSGAPAPTPDSPFPCAGCGREKPQAPREAVQARACDVCGNNLPARDGAVSIAPGVTNKPAIVRNGAVAAVVSTLSPEERAAKLALPAFGADGMPLE